jgi:hypothetical protein
MITRGRIEPHHPCRHRHYSAAQPWLVRKSSGHIDDPLEFFRSMGRRMAAARGRWRSDETQRYPAPRPGWLVRVGLTVVTAAAMLLLLAGAAWGRSVASGQANTNGSLRLNLGRAELIAPAGSLPSGATARIRQQRSPVLDAGPAFSFALSPDRVMRPIELVLPLAARATPGSEELLIYAGTHGRWFPELGRVSRSGRTIRAKVLHLSTWAGLDLTKFLLSEIDKPTAVSAVNNDCPGSSAANVSLLGPSSPLSVCVSGGNPQSETVTVHNHGSLALSLALSGGLNFPETGTPGIQALGQYVPQQSSLQLTFNATVASSSITYTENLLETVATELAPTVIGGVFGEGGAVVGANFRACAASGNVRTITAAIEDSVQCMLSVLKNDVKIDGVTFSGVLSKLAYGALVLTVKALPFLRPLEQLVAGQSNGVITLTTLLPASGGSTPPPTPPVTSGNAPPTTPTAPPPGSPAYYVYTVMGTCADGACGLHIRSGPGYSSYAIVGSLAEGAEVQIVCQAVGETVGPSPATGNSSGIWDQLLGGGWVSDLYISTPNVGTWSPPIPQC